MEKKSERVFEQESGLEGEQRERKGEKVLDIKWRILHLRNAPEESVFVVLCDLICVVGFIAIVVCNLISRSPANLGDLLGFSILTQAGKQDALRRMQQREKVEKLLEMREDQKSQMTQRQMVQDSLAIERSEGIQRKPQDGI